MFPFINFENPLYSQPKLKSIYPYQNGLDSIKLLCEIFQRINVTTKYILGGTTFQRNLVYPVPRLHKTWFRLPGVYARAA